MAYRSGQITVGTTPVLVGTFENGLPVTLKSLGGNGIYIGGSGVTASTGWLVGSYSTETKTTVSGSGDLYAVCDSGSATLNYLTIA